MSQSDAASPGKEREGLALMVLSVFLFSLNVLVLRAIALRWPGADGIMASFYRGWVGLIVVVLMYRDRGLEPRRLFNRPLVVLRGAVGAAGIVAFYVTIEHLGAGRATILNLTYPAFGALMAVVWLGEKLRLSQVLWMAGAFGGLCVFFADSLRGGDFGRFDLIGLFGAVVAGAAVVIIRLLRHTEHPSTVYASQCVWSLGVALPFCAGSIFRIPWQGAVGLVVASVLVALAQLAMTRAFHTLSVARGSSIQMGAPVLVALGGVAWFGERFTALEIAGGVGTLVATWMAVRPQPVAAVSVDRPVDRAAVGLGEKAVGGGEAAAAAKETDRER